MDPQHLQAQIQIQQQQQQQASDHDDHHNQDQGGKLASNYLCRQSSTRWTPTSEQIKILKDLYYNNGVRSPTADQIQKISARLRQYGKIEGKNVFYWFQNHKARERQKKRFTTTNEHHLLPLQRAPNIRYPTGGIACPTSAAGVVSTGCGYGHMSMESNFRESAISACAGNGGICTIPNQSFQWGAGHVNPYIHQSYSFMEETRINDGIQYQDEDHQYETPAGELETLPLFPMNAKDDDDDDDDDDDEQLPASSLCGTMTMMMRPEPVNCHSSTTSNCNYTSVSTTTSLELTLNCFGDQ